MLLWTGIASQPVANVPARIRAARTMGPSWVGHTGHTIHALARAFSRLPSGQNDRQSSKTLSRAGEIPVPGPVIHDELVGASRSPERHGQRPSHTFSYRLKVYFLRLA